MNQNDEVKNEVEIMAPFLDNQGGGGREEEWVNQFRFVISIELVLSQASISSTGESSSLLAAKFESLMFQPLFNVTATIN